MWQWIRHQTKLEDATMTTITRTMVHQIIKDFVHKMCSSSEYIHSSKNKLQLQMASEILEEIVTKRNFPEFITTYLYEEHAIRHSHGM